MSALFVGGRLVRRPPANSPPGCRIFVVAAALLVGRISLKDILPPRASQRQQISGNALVPHFDIGSNARNHWPFSGRPFEILVP
jgi:hypothetical protein